MIGNLTGETAPRTENDYVKQFLCDACLSSSYIADARLARQCEDRLIDSFMQFGFAREVAELNLLVAGSDLPRGKLLKALQSAKAEKLARLKEQFQDEPSAPPPGGTRIRRFRRG